MNDTINIILNRRSIRNFLPIQLNDADLECILKCGQYAPSSKNLQPWYFTVIQNLNILNELNQQTKYQMQQSKNEWLFMLGNMDSYNIFYNAPTVVFISYLNTKTQNIVDCAAAIQNMCIAAASLNIGSCWIGMINNLFNYTLDLPFIVPKNFIPIFALALGYIDLSKQISIPSRKMDNIAYIK